MSYFEIGIYNHKFDENIGTLFRTAYQLGASGIFTIGRKYKKDASNTPRAERHIPLRHYENFELFKSSIPKECLLIGVEFGGTPLGKFNHPKQCIYLLGNESAGIPSEIIMQCNGLIEIESIRHPSYNVSLSGGLVMYSRYLQYANKF